MVNLLQLSKLQRSQAGWTGGVAVAKTRLYFYIMLGTSEQTQGTSRHLSHGCKRERAEFSDPCTHISLATSEEEKDDASS